MVSHREKIRQTTLEEIKTLARQQMAENGTAAISLNAIARAMEMSGPALFRYYASRDDLITAMIVDSFNDYATALENAEARIPVEQYGVRLFEVCLEYRRWALEHPVDFQLIFGNPIPGYHAPLEITLPAARRSFAVNLGILVEAQQNGAIHAPQDLLPPPEIEFSRSFYLEDHAFQLSETALYLSIVGWCRIQGMVSLELYHHLQEMVNNPEALFRHEVTEFIKSIGLKI